MVSYMEQTAFCLSVPVKLLKLHVPKLHLYILIS